MTDQPAAQDERSSPDPVEERRDYVRRLVDTFRPLTEREKEKLALLFRRHL